MTKMEIRPELIDRYGLIQNPENPTNGDVVGDTCCAYFLTGDISFLIAIKDTLLRRVAVDMAQGRLVITFKLYRSPYHLKNKIDTMSRDHIMWLILAVKHSGYEGFNEFLDSLNWEYSRISEKARMTPDLYYYKKERFLLWQIIIYVFYCKIGGWWNNLLRWVGDIPMLTWEIYEAPEYYYENGKKLKGWQFINKERRRIVKGLGWDSWFQYVCARNLPKLSSITIHQISWMLFLSDKHYPGLTKAIQKNFMKMTWAGNPGLSMLLEQPMFLSWITRLYCAKTNASAREPSKFCDRGLRRCSPEEFELHNLTYELLLKLYNNPYWFKI